MRRFDYKVIPAAALSEGLLKRLGSEGWQLKQIYTEIGCAVQNAIFERELPRDIAE